MISLIRVVFYRKIYKLKKKIEIKKYYDENINFSEIYIAYIYFVLHFSSNMSFFQANRGKKTKKEIDSTYAINNKNRQSGIFLN